MGSHIAAVTTLMSQPWSYYHVVIFFLWITDLVVETKLSVKINSPNQLKRKMGKKKKVSLYAAAETTTYII